jgi:hypothetical protein
MFQHCAAQFPASHSKKRKRGYAQMEIYKMILPHEAPADGHGKFPMLFSMKMFWLLLCNSKQIYPFISHQESFPVSSFSPKLL